GLCRDDVPLRFFAAAGRVLAGEMQEHLAIRLLRLLVLPVPLESRRAEEELSALAVEVALAVLDQLRHLRVQRGPGSEPLHLPARVDERLPRVVEIARRDAALLQLAAAPVVSLPGRDNIPRSNGQHLDAHLAHRPLLALLALREGDEIAAVGGPR